MSTGIPSTSVFPSSFSPTLSATRIDSALSGWMRLMTCGISWAASASCRSNGTPPWAALLRPWLMRALQRLATCRGAFGDSLRYRNGCSVRFGKKSCHESLTLGDTLDFDRDCVHPLLESLESTGRIVRKRRCYRAARALPHHARCSERNRCEHKNDEDCGKSSADAGVHATKLA